jgi:lantibiotic modifying enzyme
VWKTVGSLGVLLAVRSPAPVQDARPVDPVRATITRAIRWLERQAVAVPESDGGVLFRGAAETRSSPQPQIYGGSAGVLLFLENAAAVLDDARARALADATAKGLLATRRTTASGALTWMPPGMKEGAVGLYSGDAGIGAAFLARGRLRSDPVAIQVATEVGDSIVARGITKGDQLCWDQQVEVIFGASGTILFLLDLAEETKDESYLNAALAAARWLLAKAVAEPSSHDAKQRLLHWRWQLAGDSPYVNFSHGTAGVAYALARVGAATSDEACARASRDAAAWLMEQGSATGDLFCFPVIAGEKTTMGGWCHGPPGTARLFLLLNRQTGDARYLDVALASARWVMAQAPPPTEGGAMAATFPPSFCCGVAGVLDFFCDLHRATGKKEFADFARRAGDYLVQTAAPESVGKEDDGVRWARGTNAHGAGREEHAVDLMQGAAGEALALLRLATLEVESDPVRHLPDRAVHDK